MVTSPRRTGMHTLDALKNWRINEKCLDYRGKISASWPTDVAVYEGMCVHQDSSGEFLPGVGASDFMPLFLRNNDYDSDVNNYGGNPATEVDAFVPIGPTGIVNTLVATGGYELLSTEYDGADNTFVRNAWLTSPLTTTAAGKIQVGTRGTHTLIGMVSRGIIQNPQKKANGVAFWSMFVPRFDLPD